MSVCVCTRILTKIKKNITIWPYRDICIVESEPFLFITEVKRLGLSLGGGRLIISYTKHLIKIMSSQGYRCLCVCMNRGCKKWDMSKCCDFSIWMFALLKTACVCFADWFFPFQSGSWLNRCYTGGRMYSVFTDAGYLSMAFSIWRTAEKLKPPPSATWHHAALFLCSDTGTKASAKNWSGQKYKSDLLVLRCLNDDELSWRLKRK